MQTTCVLIKPDAMRAHLCRLIIARLEKAGLEITGCKMLWLDSEILAEHYAHLLQKPFYHEVEAFMQSSPIIALALTGENAVSKVRALAGATNPAKAEPGTIRADFGADVMANAIHASDSPEAAESELERFFVRERAVNERGAEV
jgi:nucleoside-diphosphate kinase